MKYVKKGDVLQFSNIFATKVSEKNPFAMHTAIVEKDPLPGGVFQILNQNLDDATGERLKVNRDTLDLSVLKAGPDPTTKSFLKAYRPVSNPDAKKPRDCQSP
jgi:hypothetical protein